MKLNQKYSAEAFNAFIHEFLPDDYAEKEMDVADLSRCKIITKARELGHSPSLDVYVLEMTHAKDTDPRVSIATDAFKLLATFGYDKALVIFKNDESENYRFSYLTISLDHGEGNKVIRKYSNARRYSFYLGTGAKTKTPEQQLIGRGKVKDVEDLLSRFSLEVVNKQFYLEIAKFFDDLTDEDASNLTLPFQSDTTVRKNFAMRLIGRIMFCWFLKQKKSKDGQLVPDELLSSTAVKENYYHSTLEPLFFEMLNTQIEDRDIRGDVYDKVPYLNGGLFSPQHDDYYELDRTIFASKHINTLRISEVWFRTFFELLETYNFTIDENMVFDQELSVDPEMLGRIFENLLAEINPDTGSSQRKRTGSYYTPRRVVEYMVDQSLVEYLKTKTKIEEHRLDALVSYDLADDSDYPFSDVEKNSVVQAVESLKILDPACGSGAFPIGILQKVVWILQRVDPDCKRWLSRKLSGVPELYRQRIINEVQANPFNYTRKLDVIKNSIFGVDIQPIAVEMSRLRCFLTLVVESQIDDTKKNRNIEALPNLDFKFVCANTLIGLPKSKSKGLFEDHSGIVELSGIMSEYFTAKRTERDSIKNRFYGKQKELLTRIIELKTASDLTLKLTNWEPFENKLVSWFDSAWMFGVDEKFDVVIANPPYVDSETMTKEQPELREVYNGLYSTAKGNWDLYIPFLERGHDLLNSTGVACYITPNKWYAIGYGKEIRSKLQHHIFRVGNLNSVKVFEAGNSPVVTFFTKEIKQHQIIVDVFDESYRIESKTNIENSILDDHFGVIFAENLALISKIKSQPRRVGDYFGVENPCTVSEAYEIKKIISDLDGEIDTDRDFLFVNTGTIDPFVSLWGKKNTTYLKSKYVKPVISKEKFKEAFPRRYPQMFQPKIIVSGMRHFESFFDQHGIFVAGKSTEILVEKKDIDLKVALSILNSKLVRYYIKQNFNVLGIDGGINFTTDLIKNIPVPALKNENKILNLVDKILQSQDSDIADLKRQNDELVFDMFELSSEEKAHIRNS